MFTCSTDAFEKVYPDRVGSVFELCVRLDIDMPTVMVLEDVKDTSALALANVTLKLEPPGTLAPNVIELPEITGSTRTDADEAEFAPTESDAT